MVRSGGTSMKARWCLAAGVGLVLAALVWGQFLAHKTERAAAQRIAWARVEVGLAHMEAALRRLDAEVAVLEGALQQEELRPHAQKVLDEVLGALLQGVHGVQVALGPDWAKTQRVRGMIENAARFEDACRSLAALGQQTLQWEHRVQNLLKARQEFVLAMEGVRRMASPAPGTVSWWPPLAATVVGVILMAVGAQRRERVLESPAASVASDGAVAVLDALPVPVVLVDAAGMVRRVTPAAATLLGVEAAVDPGYAWSTLEGGGAKLDLDSLLAREVRLVRSDGTSVWVVRMVAPFLLGQEQYWLYVLWDISRRREVMQTFQAEVARWRSLVETVGCGLLAVDSAGQVVAANGAWARLCGYEQSELVELRADAVAAWSLVHGSGPWVGEWNGRWVVGHAAMWPEGGDGVRVLAAMAADELYTRGMEAGRRLILKRCLRILEHMHAEVAHVDATQTSLRILLQTLQALLDLRLGRQTLSSVEVPLRPFLRRFFQQARALGEAWEVSVHVSQGQVLDTCRVDAALLRQAMEQLFWGACQRSRRGRMLITVETTPIASGRARLVVAVQAPGDPPELPSDLDMPLGDELLEGEGLHLVVAELSVRRLGALGLTRQRGSLGTELSFSVEVEVVNLQETDDSQPSLLSEASTHEQGPAPVLGTAASPASISAGFSVLIAEDNPFNAAILESLLVRLGARRTLIVEDGARLVDAVLKDPSGFDLAVVDVEMPKLSGPEAVRQLREQGRMLPVLAITAHDDPDMETVCRKAGISAMLAKPYDVAQVAAVLRRLGFAVDA